MPKRGEYLIGPGTRHNVLERIRANPGCSRLDIAEHLGLDCDHVREVVEQLAHDGLAYQNTMTRGHHVLDSLSQEERSRLLTELGGSS